MLPEAFEGFAHLLEKLTEERIVGGVVDGQMKGKILRPGRPFGQVYAFHLLELFLDDRDVIVRSPPGRYRARLRFNAATHLQRLQKGVAEISGVQRQRHVDGRSRNRLSKIAAAAPACGDDPERLEAADHFADR